jgi:hypothetical protein
MSGGYAIVDVDEDEVGLAAKWLTQSSGNLQFKSFLPDSPAPAATPGERREVREVPYSPFNIAYYQVYFDVETTTVLRRVARALVPQGGFIADACDGQVDLYGGLASPLSSRGGREERREERREGGGQ